MKVCGIAAEYNPFHLGHAYQLRELRSRGYTHIVAVMSGNFVQRGEAAIFDKTTRTRAALLGGVDLVLELPYGFAFSTAQRFAAAAVDALDALCCVQAIGFGSECGDPAALSACATALQDSRLDPLIAARVSAGEGYAAARSGALAELYSAKIARPLQSPNDILAIEYLTALHKKGSKMQPEVIKRVGAAHDNTAADNGEICSAAHIRELLLAGADYRHTVPPECYGEYQSAIAAGRAPVSLRRGERLLLDRLRGMSAQQLEQLDDSTPELAARLYRAAQQADSLEQLYTLAKTRRYAHSRIRRLALSAALRCFTPPPPPYLRVLGMNAHGAELLRRAKMPTVSGYSQACAISCGDYYATVSAATDFYTMLMPTVQPCGFEMTQSIVKI